MVSPSLCQRRMLLAFFGRCDSLLGSREPLFFQLFRSVGLCAHLSRCVAPHANGVSPMREAR